LAGGDWETRTVRNIREWMFKNNLSSETTFEMFLKHCGKVVQKKLTRVDFHKALHMCNLHFSAPEIDGLFYLLDLNQDGELDLDEWRSRIYEDCMNPLQMLREVVANNKLTSDDLLFKMQLRIWDGPLDFPKLCDCLRRLDPTLSEPQLRHLAKSLKNKDGKVEVTSLLRNLCGQEHETVDFRNKIFREIYAEIHPHKEDQLQQLLEDADPLNDGRLEPQGLKVALKKVLKKVDEESIDRFIRFLDKDSSGKVNYMEFLGRMSEVSNRDHNPFKSVV
jgi:Ca2+-binding EF-hand superfamily protein